MQYDPIKQRLSNLIGKSNLLRRLFFRSLDLLFLRAWYVHRELQRLKSAINNQQSTILDAGMGFGQYFDRMNRMYRMYGDTKVIGLEIDMKHLYGAEGYFKKVHPHSCIVIGDVQILPFTDQKFDLVLTVDVMEHVKDDLAAFTEFSRVLKPGGFLLMHTPRIVEDAPRWNPPLPPPASQGGRENWHVDEHVRDGYRDWEAVERLEKAGLKALKIVHGYGWAGRIAWILLQRIPISMLAKGKFMFLPTLLYLIVALPIGICGMALDYSKKNHPNGGSLLVVAQRDEQS